MKILKTTLSIFLSVFALAVYAQEKPLSPQETINAKLDGANTTIVYCRPSARGRTMIGGKEPFGEVWRTGANAATTIEFDKDVKIEGKDLKAGKYSLFTIPNKSEWVVIFNTVHTQWGAYDYDKSKDALRVNVKVEKPKAFVEQFTISTDKDKVTMAWENYQASFTVKSK
ncbi:MAG TPA: DUF2911 domain-containing protein [Chryseosolibacter sp.]